MTASQQLLQQVWILAYSYGIVHYLPYTLNFADTPACPVLPDGQREMQHTVELQGDGFAVSIPKALCRFL